MSILLSALYKFGLHGINDIFLLLAHSLTQSVTLASGKVCQQTGEQHHLLLIHRYAIGVLQIFFHDRDVIVDLFPAIFSIDKRRNIIHRSRTIQSIHGYQVLKYCRMQFLQIFLHSGRLKLECADGTPFLIELICQLVIQRQVV